MPRGSESGASASRLTVDELGDMSDKDIESALRQSQKEDDEVDPASAKHQVDDLLGQFEDHEKSTDDSQTEDEDGEPSEDNAEPGEKTSVQQQTSHSTDPEMLKLVNGLREEITELRKERASAAQPAEEASFDYDVGDLSEDGETSREAANIVGTHSEGERRKLRTEFGKHLQTAYSRIDDLESTVVKMRLEVSPEEEKQMVKWAQSMNLSYKDTTGLTRIISDYRDVARAREIVAGKGKAARKAKATGGTPRNASQNSQTKKATITQGESNFDRNFDRHASNILSDLKSGKVQF